jgi:2-keto-3-deoxy-L-rhamnonate aldolase RhmA
MTTFKQRLAAGDLRGAVGTWLMSASPIVTEAVGRAGFDWAVVDMEHTPIDLMGLVHLLQACGCTPMQPVVRVPWNDTVTIKRAMDAGAGTLLVPFVQNVDEARAAVDASRYPPLGNRGMAAMSRASRFGTVASYFRQANDDACVIVQLETPEAIANLEAIAAVPGVDALFIGPGDLSGAMGVPGDMGNPEVVALIADAVQRANRIGKPVGTVGPTTEALRRYRDMGFDFLAIASDLGLLMRSLRQALDETRQVLATGA